MSLARVMAAPVLLYHGEPCLSLDDDAIDLLRHLQMMPGRKKFEKRIRCSASAGRLRVSVGALTHRWKRAGAGRFLFVHQLALGMRAGRRMLALVRLRGPELLRF